MDLKFVGVPVTREKALLSEEHFELFISVKQFRDRFACTKCSSMKGFSLDRGGTKNPDGRYQRRLKFQCCQASCSYACFSSSIRKFCLENDINLDESDGSQLSSPASLITQEPNSGLGLLTPIPSRSTSESQPLPFSSPSQPNASDGLSSTPSYVSQAFSLPSLPGSVSQQLTCPISDSKRRKIQSLDSGSDEGDDHEATMKVVGVSQSNVSYMNSMMKSMVSTFAQEMKSQMISELGAVIGQAIAAQNNEFQNELVVMKRKQDELLNMIQDLQKVRSPPPVSYASVTSKMPSAMSSPNGRKSPVPLTSRPTDASKFMRHDTDASLFSERVSKLRQSSVKSSASKSLVTIYALRVRDIQPKEIRETLKQTTFNPRVIKDICYVSRNTLAFTVIKSSLPMLQEILQVLFGWTTTLTFDPSVTFNPDAPDEIKDQVRSGSIRTYAKYLFRAEFIVKDDVLLAHHKQFVDSKGDVYAKEVEDFIQVIKIDPTKFFPNYKSEPIDVLNDPDVANESHDAEPDCIDDNGVADMSFTVEEVSEPTEQMIIPDTIGHWADEAVDVEPDMNVEYEEDVPTCVEDPSLC